MEKYIKIIIFSVLVFLVMASLGIAVFVSVYKPKEKSPVTIPRVFWKRPERQDEIEKDIVGIDEIQEGSLAIPEETEKKVIKNSVEIGDILTSAPEENKIDDTTISNLKRDEMLELDTPVDITSRGVTATRNFVQRDIEKLNISRLFGKTIRK